MRTIKFLLLTLGFSAATPALAQSGLQPGAFPRIDRFVRIEARRIERQHLQRQLAANRQRHARLALHGARPVLRAQMRAGKLTREQAHTQLRSWITEHRPTK